MKWYLITSKSDDYGASNKMMIKCAKKYMKCVYHYEEVTDETEIKILSKYLGVVNDYLDENDDLEEYLETYF